MLQKNQPEYKKIAIFIALNLYPDVEEVVAPVKKRSLISTSG